MMRRRPTVWGCCALLLAGSALARHAPRPVDAAVAPPSHPGRGLAAFGQAAGNRDRIIEAIQRRYNAQVVRVSEVNDNGRIVYEMRLLSDRKVWNIRVDAETGQVLQGAE